MGGHSRQKLDLMGQRYGDLTVISSADNVGGRTAWRCRCSCGQELVAKTAHLRSGRTVSCGCQREQRPDTALGLTYIDGTCVEMLRAKKLRCSNTSGATGVDWWTSKGRWRASICFKGKRHYLGSYTRFEDAVKAYRRGEEVLHDRFLQEFAACQEAAGG